MEPAAKRLCSSAAAAAVRRVAIEGNIAAGKSTFLRLLEESSPAYSVVSEPLTRWTSVPGEDQDLTCSQQHGGNLLDLFYKEPNRWAYTFQTYACISRIRAQLRPVPDELLAGATMTAKPILFFERSVYSDRYIFAKNCHDSGLLSDMEWHMYCDWHTFLTDSLPLKFDAIVYLRTDPAVCYGRLQKRGRPEESTVSEDYLRALHEKHEQWLVHKEIKLPQPLVGVPVLSLDCSPEFEQDRERTSGLIQQVAEFISKLPGSQQ